MSVNNKKKAVSDSNHSNSDFDDSNDPFRLIMSKESRLYYDKKMEANKNRSYEELIEKNQKMIDSGRLVYCRFRGEQMIHKKLKMKYLYLDMSIEKQLNPLQHVRIGDNVFKLDSSVLSLDNRTDWDINYKVHTFKRAVEMIYDQKELVYTVKLEERYPITQNFKKSLSSMWYYIDWLKSLGDYRANNLSIALQNYMKSLFKSEYF